MPGANFLCNGKLNFDKLIMQDTKYFFLQNGKLKERAAASPPERLTIEYNDDIIIL